MLWNEKLLLIEAFEALGARVARVGKKGTHEISRQNHRKERRGDPWMKKKKKKKKKKK